MWISRDLWHSKYIINRSDQEIKPLEQSIWLSLIFVGCLLPVSNFFPGNTLAYAPAALVYVVFLSRVLLFSSERVFFPRLFVIPTFVLICLYLTHGILAVSSGSLSALVKGSAFIIFLLVNVFVIPQQIKFSAFLKALTNVLFLIVALGILTIGIEFGFQNVIGRNLPYFQRPIPALTSIIANVNAFGRLAGVGFVASIISYNISRNNTYLLVGMILGVGTLASTARSSIIAVTGILILHSLFWYGKGRIAVYAIFISLIGGIGVIGMVTLFTLLEQPLPITLSKRNIYWAGAIQVVLNSPLLGTGPVNTATHIGNYVSLTPRTSHNSFFRMFVTTGTFEGISFLYLFYSGFRSGFASVFSSESNQTSVGKLLLFYFVVIEMMLSSFSIVGLRLSSVIGAMALGFVLNSRSDL
jgi:O-antigen ligase